MDAQDPVLARLLDRVDGAREHHAPLQTASLKTKTWCAPRRSSRRVSATYPTIRGMPLIAWLASGSAATLPGKPDTLGLVDKESRLSQLPGFRF